VNGNEAWLTEKEWNDFLEYERDLNGVIAKQRMIALCTYPLAVSRAGDIFDVARAHEFAIARRHGNWEVLETPELRQAKAKIDRLNGELEQQVRERTKELAAANEDLRKEIAERKAAVEALAATTGQLRSLSGSLQLAREEERARIARELHDELGSALTSLSWDLQGVNKMLSAAESKGGELRKKITSMTNLVDSTIDTVRRIASELRPGILDDLGLMAAIEWRVEQLKAHSGIIYQCDFLAENIDLSREQTTALFHIFQEATTNILRHAQATRVNIRVEETEGQFVLQVSDDGRGITREEKTGARSLGLIGMRERAHLIGGKIKIDGVRGKGTVLTVVIPLRIGVSD